MRRGGRISLICQDPAVSLNPVLKTARQIAEVLRAHNRISRAERKKRVEELLRAVGFEDTERISAAYPHELSGGERQRVVIAQAMACRPALVVADEPTSKLDPALQTQILTILAELIYRQHTALVFITHDPALLSGIADRIAVMYAGRIVEEGTAKEVLEKPLHPYTQALVRLSKSHLLASGNTRILFPAIPGELPDLARLDKGCHFEPRCRERLPLCGVRDPEMFEIETTRRVGCFKYVN
jgi:peptide/nickel transport system ATP-binding protein